MLPLLATHWTVRLEFAWCFVDHNPADGRLEDGSLDPTIALIALACHLDLQQALDAVWGVTPVSVVTAARIASILGVPLGELLQVDFLLHGDRGDFPEGGVTA